MQATAQIIFYACLLVWAILLVRSLAVLRRRRTDLSQAVDRYTIWIDSVVIPRQLTRHDATAYIAHLPEQDWGKWLSQVSEWAYRTYRMKIDHRLTIGRTGRRLHLIFPHWQRLEQHRNFSA